MRPSIIIILAILALFGVAACSPQEAPQSIGATEQAQSANDLIHSVHKVDAEPQSAVLGSGTMKKSCGGAEMRLRVNIAVAENSPATSLEAVWPSGEVMLIAKPKELEDYSAIGLACVLSSTDSKPYFVVQYGELPKGCAFCEWYYLYDAQGKQLTQSNPPILMDESLPEPQRQSPNTKEYEAAIVKLGIEHPEIDYVK